MQDVQDSLSSIVGTGVCVCCGIQVCELGLALVTCFDYQKLSYHVTSVSSFPASILELLRKYSFADANSC